MRAGLGLRFSLAAVLPAAVAARSPGDPMAEFLAQVNRPVVYTVREWTACARGRILVYKRDGALELKLDLYLPETSAPGKRVPVVFLIHGGVGPEFPVRPKDWGFYKTWGRLLAASGLAAVAFNHRVGFPILNLAAASGDVRERGCVRSKSRAGLFDRPGADRARRLLGRRPMLSMALREPKPSVRCLVAFYAFLDLQASPLHRKYLGESRFSKFSPVPPLPERRDAAADFRGAVEGPDPQTFSPASTASSRRRSPATSL